MKHLSSRPHEYASRSFASREVADLLLVESASSPPHCLLLFKCPPLTATLCPTAQISGEKTSKVSTMFRCSVRFRRTKIISVSESLIAINISEFLHIALQRFVFSISSGDRLNPFDRARYVSAWRDRTVRATREAQKAPPLDDQSDVITTAKDRANKMLLMSALTKPNYITIRINYHKHITHQSSLNVITFQHFIVHQSSSIISHRQYLLINGNYKVFEFFKQLIENYLIIKKFSAEVSPKY